MSQSQSYSSGSSNTTQTIQTTRTIVKTLPNGKQVKETITESKTYVNGKEVKSDSSDKHDKKAIESKRKPKIAVDSSASSSDEDDSDDFVKDALTAHNMYRKKHGVKSLKLSPELCNYAKEWAKKLANEDKSQHRPDGTYGENIYTYRSSNPKAKVAGSVPVEKWYSEIEKYTFGVDKGPMGTGHFTQVIWKGSKKMGIGKAKAKSGRTYVVANYEPAGNLIGAYAKNVPPPMQ